MYGQVWTIAWFTLLESLRSRMFWLVLAILGVALGMAQFLGTLAITESQQIQVGFMAYFLRLTGVLLISLFVISSVVREFDDKVLELLLSLPLPRAVYFLGKLTGFALFALGTAVLFCLSLAFYAPVEQIVIWGISLWAEFLMVTALSLLCLFTFNQITVALSVVFAFYLLARGMGAIQLMAHEPLLVNDSMTQEVAGWLVDAIAFILPDLYRFTSSDWLVYGDGNWQSLVPLVTQAAIYLLLLAGAALFDLYRKNF